MPSDHVRLHPASLLFSFGKSARVIVIPTLLFMLSMDRPPDGWWTRFDYGWRGGPGYWVLLFLIPTLIIAVAKYLSFRLRYAGTELVIRSGIVFRNERHIPYARIQNLDAVQNVLHRVLKVVEVRVETGGGNEPEATISVLPIAALAEMRRRVFAHRAEAQAQVAAPGATDAAGDAPADATADGSLLLHLPLRELLLCGFIENRGLVIVGASYGVLWETGLLDRLWAPVFGFDGSGTPSSVRTIIAAVRSGGGISFRQVLIAAGGLAGLLILVRLLSMAWATIRLYDFRLTRSGDDLRAQFGLLTREMTTIPLRRIQTLTIRETPLHRLTRRVAVRAQTAGGGATNAGEGRKRPREREWLAPLVRRSALPALVAQVMPELHLESVDWQPVHPRAFRRAMKPPLIFAVIATGLLAWPLGWLSVFVFAALAAWAVVSARHHVRHLGWARDDHLVMFQSGWLWRQTTIARVVKIQAVTLAESPFDRRAAMAQVLVDTAGAAEGTHRVRIPYLGRDVAEALRRQLAAQAANTAFRW